MEHFVGVTQLLHYLPDERDSFLRSHVALTVEIFHSTLLVTGYSESIFCVERRDLSVTVIETSAIPKINRGDEVLVNQSANIAGRVHIIGCNGRQNRQINLLHIIRNL